MNEKPKRKPGRPKLPKEAKKSKIIPLRLTEEELREYLAKAEKEGVGISTWIRLKIKKPE